jgi:antitoxin component YwqK of YwqJK toxin-antitoxin module
MKKIIKIILCFILFIHLFSCNNRTSVKEQKIEGYHYVYTNGERTIGTLIDGEKYGYWCSVDSNGLIVLELNYQNDTVHGPWRSYSNRGLLTGIGYYNRGTLDSIYIGYDGSFVIDSGRYDMGTKIGEWRYYEIKDGDFDGGLSYVIEYRNNDTIVLFDGGLVPPLPNGKPAWKSL